MEKPRRFIRLKAKVQMARRAPWNRKWGAGAGEGEPKRFMRRDA